jgi:hypothetical protein
MIISEITVYNYIWVSNSILGGKTEFDSVLFLFYKIYIFWLIIYLVVLLYLIICSMI